jgi:putative oxidoreductase
MNIALWVVQALLALAFLLAGFGKATQPLDRLSRRMEWVKVVPSGLTRFIGVSEMLGATGLILPALTHVLPWLTIAAAVGLTLVMIFAAVFHASRHEYSGILMNVVLLVLALFVVYGRWMLVPLA